ncbi:MAG: lysophospholipase, partial [Planctomycetaceae bacterium]
SPIRFHIGLADEGLHPTPARRAVAAGGGQASEVSVAHGSHRVTFMASLYGEPRHLAGQTNTLDWFNSLR